MIAPNPSLDAALELLNRGFAVIPVPHREKAPRIKGWQHLRLDREGISLHFMNDPLNVGMLLGEPSGWVVDVDLDHDVAVKLADTYLPKTDAVFGRDSRPRSHRLYRVTASVETRKWKSSKGMLVELRSTGTQTIAPGSTHPSGEFVRWDDAGDPSSVDAEQLVESLEALSGAVRERLGEPEHARRRSENARNPEVQRGREDACRAFIAQHCRDSIEGQRGDDALFRVACETVRFDLDWAVAMRVMREFNSERCSPAWPEDRLRYKLEEAERHAARGEALRGSPVNVPDADAWPELRDIPKGGEPPQFPIGVAFPEAASSAREFLEAVAENLQVPPEVPAMLALPLVSLAISGRAKVLVRPGWVEPPPIWTLSLLPSGERKSAVFRDVCAPLFEYERVEVERLKTVIAEATECERVAKKRLQAARGAAANAEGPEAQALERRAVQLASDLEGMTVPQAPRLRTSEPTPEAVADLIARNQGRLLLAAPEAGAFDTMMGRYQRGVPNFDIYLCGHAGDPISIDRKHGGSVRIDEPLLSVGMTVQPEAVRELFTNRQAVGRGLLSRFLLSAPTSRIGRRRLDAEPVPDRLSETWGAWVMHLLDLPWREDPILVGLSPGADRAMSDFRESIEARLAPGADLEDHRDFGSKLPGTAARIALSLHALCEWARGALSPAINDEISEETMRSALTWAHWAIDARRHALESVGADADLQLARKIARWILDKRHKSFTRSEAYAARRTHAVRSPDDLDAPLENLVELGWVRRAATRRGRGRPALRYEVNPRALHRACVNGGNAV